VERIAEITEAAAFQCHKTVDYSGDDGPESGDKPQQCAGLMAMLHREGKPNQMMQLAERLGFEGFDPEKLDPDGVCYESIDDAMCEHDPQGAELELDIVG
jgi:hypothetical protein